MIVVDSSVRIDHFNGAVTRETEILDTQLGVEPLGMMTSYRHQGASVMTATVRKTISLPPDLARDAEETARAEGKTLSAVVRDALRQTRATRLREELGALQDYWGRQAKERAILSEEDLRRYLET